MNKIEELFIQNGKALIRPSGKWFILSKENSLAFINACKNESIRLQGIDGFFLRDKEIQPSLEDSIDFTVSGFNYSGNLYDLASNFILLRNENLFYQIICEKNNVVPFGDSVT